MKHLYVLVILAFLANCQSCLGDIIFTITPTQRVDADTQVTITYSITGAADTGTQDFAAFFVRVNFPASIFPANSLPFSPTGITVAPPNTPFGVGGPFDNINVSPGTNAIRWQANTLSQPTSGPNRTLDTTGALVGTFDLVWNRLANPYDAAIPVDRLIGSYQVAGGSFDQPITGQSSVGIGVNTIIAIPEPSALTMVALAALLGAGSFRRRLP